MAVWLLSCSGALRVETACVILLPFAAGSRESNWSSCIKAAMVICQKIFSILALVIFLLNSFYKVLENLLFFSLASRSGFGAAIPTPLRVVLLCFRIQSLQIAL